jgi:cell pole-organizing protein PopZ
MSELQPSIEEILASIRARVNAAPHAAPPVAVERAVVEVADTVSAAVPELGRIETGSGTTLEDLVRTLLTPMLKSWLDAHLPEIVDRAARAEIRRLTGRD